jgi:hypothetical protein
MSRPRGFIENWKPKPHVHELICNVVSVIADNYDILPLTLRQIFYLLVSNHNYDKTERAYSRLCETMNKARRAQFIGMDSIRDDGFREISNSGWESEQSIIEAIKESAATFRLDRQEGQNPHLMLWCEAGGMVPQLVNAAQDFGVPVLSSGGFDSLTTKHDMAKAISEYTSVEILHIGDHDPSGVHICSSLGEDLLAFLDHFGFKEMLTVTRLAVTPDQVQEMGLPTAPAKSTDRRSFSGQTTQAEAIPPKRLREIVIKAIEDRRSRATFEEILGQEQAIRESLLARLGGL